MQSCQKSFDHVYDGLFLGPYSIPLAYMSIFMPVPHCFDYCSTNKTPQETPVVKFLK